MNILEAENILFQIEKTRYVDLKSTLIASAIRYARIRTDWYSLSLEERKDADASRTRAHNAFIDSCNILSRNMGKAEEDIRWRAELGDERKRIGDFACYLHCLLGIRSR